MSIRRRIASEGLAISTVATFVSSLAKKKISGRYFVRVRFTDGFTVVVLQKDFLIV